MKTNRIYTILIMLMALSCNVIGQTLSVSSIEIEYGKQAELVINVDNISNMTALQFNLSLPKGISLDEANILKGQAIANHKLMIRPLAGGARMFVIYNLNKAPITDGELLRLPISLDDKVGVLNGSLNLVRTATPLAVSHKCNDVPFIIKIINKPYLRGDANGDGEIGMPDVMFIVNYILGTPAETFDAIAADANLDGEIGMPDVMFIVNYILNGKFPDEE